jgi:hypothetical protein
MTMSLYDVACLQRSVAVRAVYKLWKKGAWKELDELGLGREIQRPFEDASDYLPGLSPRNDQQTETFLGALPDGVRERVILAADLLTMSYRYLFQEDIARDAMLKGPNDGRHAEAGQEPRTRKRSRSRR